MTYDLVVNPQTHSVTAGADSIGFTVSEIDTVIGHAGGHDTWQGLDANSTWPLETSSSHSASCGVAISFSGFETLRGEITRTRSM